MAADTFSFDLETTSFNALTGRITGFSVAVDTELVPAACVYKCCDTDTMKFPKAWYFQFVPDLLEHLSYEEAEAGYEQCYPVIATWAAFRELFACEDKRIVMHNGKFDLKFAIRAGLEIKNVLIDTAIAAWLLNENRGTQKLKDLVKLFFKHDMVKFTDLGGLFSPPIALYGADDAAQTLRLWRYLEPMLVKQRMMKVFIECECRVARVLANMELTGALIDLDMISEMKSTVHAELEEVTLEIYKLAGQEFNINSNKELARVLFKDLKWKVFDWARSAKTQQPSTAKKVLEKFEARQPLAVALLRYSELYKIATGYTDPLVIAAKKIDGRIRGKFNQIQDPRGGGGTVTGRLSASSDNDLGGVNLQTIPSRSETGKKIRYMFVAPEGYKLLCIDYSQVELRFLAHLSRDKALVAAYCDWDCFECGEKGSTRLRLFKCPKCGAGAG
ncbi:unnamed protein product, partial [marine sediment metagenome]